MDLNSLIRDVMNTNRFNNFSVVLISVEQYKCWNNMNSEEKIKDIINKINKDLDETGKSKMIGTYLLTNVYNLDIYATYAIDILVANLPSNQPLLFGGQTIDILNFKCKYTSSPLYCNMLSWNDNYKMSYTSATNDIDNEKLFQSELVI